MTSPRIGLAGAWGIAGVVAILVEAIVRLLPFVRTLELHSLSPLQLAGLFGWIVVMSVAEGYRGFHRQFSPRVVARAVHLAAHPRWWLVLVAPLYCMGLVHATRRRLITTWLVLGAVVALVLGVRELAPPWRGIVDAGVVAGLAIGSLSIGYFVVVALRGRALPVPADVPTS